MALNTRDGHTLCHGSWRSFFQPLTTSKPSVQLGQETGDFLGIVLQVGVEGHQALAAGLGETGERAAALPKLRRKRMPCTRGSAAARRADHVPRTVAGAVVDEDDFDLVALRRHHVGQLAVQRLQAIGFVENRDDDGEHGGGRVAGGGWRGTRGAAAC